jgi:hypothetical protein
MTTAAPEDREGWVARWRGLGATSQALVPGVYAWAVTVEPVAWSRDGTAGAKVAAMACLGALFVGPLFERRSPDLVRMVSGWGVVMASIAVWVVAPEGAFAAFDSARGLAGMLGWALFAFASASPAREAGPGTPLGSPLRPRLATSRADTLLLFAGLALAVALEAFGWKVADRDRALLVRMTAVAGGLGLITAAGAMAIHRGLPLDEPRVPRPKRRRLQTRPVLWSLLATGLVGLGALYQLWLAR